MADPVTVFDRRAVRQHRDRAAPDFRDHDFLFVAAAEQLIDRLADMGRPFPLVLELGARDGLMARVAAGRGVLGTIVQTDLSPVMLGKGKGLRVAADAERLPLQPGLFDLVVSCLDLHWVNDLPGALIQARRALKPDGLFLASVFGGDTLAELRQSLAAAELAGEGGVSPRCSPLLDIRDAGHLLQRAGFAEPVVDSETITVSYGDPLKLLHDLRGMGETNAVIERRKSFTRRTTLFDALGRYLADFAGPDGRIPATFQILTLTAWGAPADQDVESGGGGK